MDNQTAPETTNNSQESTTTLPKAKLSALLRFSSFGRTQTPEKFPPESWTTEGVQYGGVVGTETVPFYEHKETTLSSSGVDRELEVTNSNDPSQLAVRIRQLIGLLPADPSPNPEGTPSPAPNLVDERLRSLLSSEKVMNGTTSAPSVWSLLERMRPFKPTKPIQDKGSQDQEDLDAEPEGVMMYTSLTPDKDSEPEIASITEKETGPEGNDRPEGSNTPTKKREKKVWVPSPEKLSVEANWWGFRIYLPPPVMAYLGRAQPAATKQAAVITAALKWMLDKVPVLMAPPALRPGLIVLKRLIPYVGSIGVFVSWSWNTIAKYDKGKGVVLTASWLLPVALVPSSWPGDEGETSTPAPRPATTEPQAENPGSANGSMSNPETPKEEKTETKSTWSRLWKGKEKTT